VACYRAAIALDPKSAAAFRGLGDALAKMGRLAEADDAYRRAKEAERLAAGK
jgi:Flp pilus assembly protein TadD